MKTSEALRTFYQQQFGDEIDNDLVSSTKQGVFLLYVQAGGGDQLPKLYSDCMFRIPFDILQAKEKNPDEAKIMLTRAIGKTQALEQVMGANLAEPTEEEMKPFADMLVTLINSADISLTNIHEYDELFKPKDKNA